MKNYKFLLKPLFFIFNLIFATVLVLGIEKLSPSHLGKMGSVFEKKENKTAKHKRPELHRLFSDYKAGRIDSLEFDNRLVKLLEEPTD